jgi:hypothetical protein
MSFTSFASYVVPCEDLDVRLDRWFSRHLPGMCPPRAQGLFQKSLRQKKIRLNTIKAMTSTRLKAGDFLSVNASLQGQPSLQLVRNLSSPTKPSRDLKKSLLGL